MLAETRTGARRPRLATTVLQANCVLLNRARMANALPGIDAGLFYLCLAPGRACLPPLRCAARLLRAGEQVVVDLGNPHRCLSQSSQCSETKRSSSLDCRSRDRSLIHAPGGVA